MKEEVIAQKVDVLKKAKAETHKEADAEAETDNIENLKESDNYKKFNSFIENSNIYSSLTKQIEDIFIKIN